VAIAVPRALVDHILLGPPDDRRQLQDSPILGDVWTAFARQPDQAQELLLTPFRTETARSVAIAIEGQLHRSAADDPNVAFLQGVVAAKLYFHEVLRVVVPMTGWWHSARTQQELKIFLDSNEGPKKLSRAVDHVLEVAEQLSSPSRRVETTRCSALDRYVALAGVMLWAADHSPRKARASRKPTEDVFADALKAAGAQAIRDRLTKLFQAIQKVQSQGKLVFQISMNRTASSAIARSVLAVKGDAARTLFDVNCKDIAWAVVDSGIDRTHPAFMDTAGKESRVRKSFDFTHLRYIVSLGNSKPAIRKANLDRLRRHRTEALPENAEAILAELAEDARTGRGINWEQVEEMVALKGHEPPQSDHGTHVAGIIGANKTGAENATKLANGAPLEGCQNGMCPDINLYDFRVLAPNLEDTEFAVIAALQYIRYLNDRHRFIVIHGVNLSLSIPHDVRNYACGLTPVCLECEQLVENGIVVVAAAGNLGYHSFETSNGSYEGYAALSVTDPGNADGVITVGSTHRHSPYTYGVSFFSSRGPTGDGRPKPDLVAPGERICGPLPGPDWGDLDGTSMAAPHVSGAAAMLMARYSELIGRPRRIKRILCESATDLGRERSFQGHGMLDVLRAFQNV
jgi:serine protease AprX